MTANCFVKSIVIVAAFVSSGCSVFGIRTSEELQFKVVEQSEDIEIREYEPYISAEATMSGDYDEVQTKLFKTLAGYIFGNNASEKKIAMTAPVIMDSREAKDGEKIDMTAPVKVSTSKANSWKMAFSMPSQYTIETLPKPLSQDVELVEVPIKIYAVIRYSGFFDDEENRQENLKALLKWLEEQTDYQPVGEPQYAGYDPPFTIPFLRRNEVLIEVKKTEM